MTNICPKGKAFLVNWAETKPALLSSHGKLLTCASVVLLELLLVLKPWYRSIWGRSSWSGEKLPLVFREDLAATGVVSINCWKAYRTGTLNFDFLIAFPPLKVTTFKLFLDLKSRLGGIMVSKAFSKPRLKGFAGYGTRPWVLSGLNR